VNRALRAATMGVLLLSPVVLSACSAGQVTQTATQERDKTGAQAQVGDLSLREAELLHPRGGTYEPGDDADLRIAIVNAGGEDDTLTGVEGEGFGGAEIQSSASAGATSGAAATGSASARGTQEIEIPAGTTVFVGEDEFNITLTDLDEALTTGQYIEVTFTFEKAGDVTLPLTVATPDESEARGEAFDFHEEESGETARERESADSEG
jgi:copper(I)-binding protein